MRFAAAWMLSLIVAATAGAAPAGAETLFLTCHFVGDDIALADRQPFRLDIDERSVISSRSGSGLVGIDGFVITVSPTAITFGRPRKKFFVNINRESGEMTWVEQQVFVGVCEKYVPSEKF